MQLCHINHPEICFTTVLCPLCLEIDRNSNLKDELAAANKRIEEIQYSIDITKGALEVQAATMSSLLSTIEKVEEKTRRIQELETQKKISQELASDNCAWGKDTCG